MCVHSHSSVNLRKYHVDYLPAAVKDDNTMTMATASRVVLNALETFKLCQLRFPLQTS